MEMIEKGKRFLWRGILMLAQFAVWTVLVQTMDVQGAGETGREVGFSTFNIWFHDLTGVHMWLYAVTDWLGLVPVAVCLLFGGIGLIQMLKRKSLLKVDHDLILLGFYYVLVMLGYLIFEMIPINYRPIFIEGRLEASYPSSTTLLVLSVMPTLGFQAHRRLQKTQVKKIICVLTTLFSSFMVIGRLISGVHWFTDIVGSILLSSGLFSMYKAMVWVSFKEDI